MWPLILACASVIVFATPGHAQSLATKIDDYVKAQPGIAFSGVIMVARDGKVLFNRAYGTADADLGVPNHIDSRFGIGSLTKPLTAAAALRLIERGQLRLDDAICTYMRQCPPAWHTVTIEHLLSHTSGIPDLFRALPPAPLDSMRHVVDLGIAPHMTDTLVSAPGERYAYSNFGYFLVAYAMEVASGHPWESVLRTEIFDRAGMRDTEYDDVWRVLPRRSRGYRIVQDSLRHIRYRDHGAYAAGGLLSSASDLLRFDQALAEGRLVTDSTRQAMFAVRRADYGLGWQVIRAFGRYLRNHTGGTNGFSSWLGHLDDGTSVIVLRNVEGAAAAKAIGCDIIALALGLEPSPAGPTRMPCRPEP